MLAAALMQQSAPADVAVDFIGQWGGPSYAVAADGTHAYVGVGPRLVVLDIADPAHPALLGRTGVLGGVVRDIVLAGGYAYVAAGSAGLIVIDVSNPAAPVQVGAVDTAGDARGVALAGTHAYVADAWMGIAVA